MSRQLSRRVIKPGTADTVARPLPLETVGRKTGQEGIAHASNMEVLPKHGLISREQLRRIFSDEFEAAFEEARKAGLEAAREEVALELAEAETRNSESMRLIEEREEKLLLENAEQLKHVIEALSAQRGAIFKQAEATVVELVFACLVKILGDAAIEGALIPKLVANVVDTLPNDELLTLRLSISDHALLDEATALVDRKGKPIKVRLKADPDLKIGDCVIENDRGQLDAGLDRQLTGLREVLLKTHERVTVQDERENS